MMDARLGWLTLGGVIGFILGYIVRSLRDRKARMIERGERVARRKTSDDGFVRNPIILDIALVLVIAFTVAASFLSQKASNDVKTSQASQDKRDTCTQQYLTKTIKALNARTEFTVEQGAANLTLQRAQLDFLSTFLKEPPPNNAENMRAFRDYVVALTHYIEVTTKSNTAVATNPYPTDNEFQNCITKK